MKIIVRSLLLAIILIIMTINVYADVVVYSSNATFSVTVPMILPIDMDEMGNVYVSTSAEVKNNSAGPVKIESVEVSVMNGWKLVDFYTDFRSEKVGLREFGMNIQGYDVDLDGSLSINWSDIPAGENLALDYSAVVAAQPYNITNEYIANVIFTVGWGDGYDPTEPLEDTWSPDVTYYVGEEVIYDGRIFTPHWNSVKGAVPGLVDSPWQEITDEWRIFNIYNTNGTIVWHNGVQYRSTNYSKGAEPGTSQGDGKWFEITDEWRASNIYVGGEIVWHNGVKYKAKWYTKGDEPPAQVWEVIP